MKLKLRYILLPLCIIAGVWALFYFIMYTHNHRSMSGTDVIVTTILGGWGAAAVIKGALFIDKNW